MNSVVDISRRASSEKLKINEMFVSLQGESTTVGVPTVFIRLTGCPLRCHYCDTAYAFRSGEYREVSRLLEDVSGFGISHVTVTGGEPLAQPACLGLLQGLCEAGYRVSIETSGAMDISQVDSRVMKVVDVKTPGSGEQQRNLFSNFQHLRAGDQLKFVICHREDYLWASSLLGRISLPAGCEVLFSPSFSEQDARQLADWIIEDRLPVRFQLQLHKILWGDQPGR